MDVYKIDKLFYNWLIVTFLLVFSMIIVGGLTRLTNSGLSITEWELFKGILPPLNQSTWDKYFLLYKEIPPPFGVFGISTMYLPAIEINVLSAAPF